MTWPGRGGGTSPPPLADRGGAPAGGKGGGVAACGHPQRALWRQPSAWNGSSCRLATWLKVRYPRVRTQTLFLAHARDAYDHNVGPSTRPVGSPAARRCVETSVSRSLTRARSSRSHASVCCSVPCAGREPYFSWRVVLRSRVAKRRPRHVLRAACGHATPCDPGTGHSALLGQMAAANAVGWAHTHTVYVCMCVCV